MITLKNFKRYQPENPPVSATYLISEDGKDWYEAQKLFATDTFKVAYDSQGVIRTAHYDVSGLFPEGLSVSEIDKNEVPEGFRNDHTWQYKEGKIIRQGLTPEVLRRQAEYQRQGLIVQARENIASLQDAADLLIATVRERADLSAWKRYRLALYRLDISTAPDIDWPKLPE
ncbi:tail fiber assembly protein [Xenorhabdus bovienii]|uniref:tail fiber assembly protein n=1 Tax=Xenorhabdus bovienii TaxID=40576 RepID=UPI0023B27428|nr:tail fiber assembly protein [Xenorhabdus bovienii]MDE9455994.1 tail fiber assembly protein [Xenorhabdus bovienii]